MSANTRQVRLDNGLYVILREARTAPIVSTWLWYRVGSRDEVEGATGMSHWVEHMMFKGSSQFPKGSIMREVDRHGGYLNAMTSYDFTAYYNTLPADHAELALRIESDRMQSALFDPAEIESERTVVIAEREGSENEPAYMLSESATAEAFQLHPYHHQPVGWKTDLQRITPEQLTAHYRRYYVPNNAVLVAVGDFDANEHLALIERYFAAIPPGELPVRNVPAEPPQSTERRVTVRMPGSAPINRISYHTPPVSHPDYIPLVVLDAVLSGGKAMFAFGGTQARSARLYRALVETQLASSVGSNYHPSLDPFLLTLGATVRDGREPEEVEAALLAEIEKLRREPVEARELAVAVRQTQAQFAYSSEGVNQQGLALGYLEMVDDHRRMDGLLDEIAAVTAEDVLRVANIYLTPSNRVVGWFYPEGEGGQEESPAAAPAWSPREPGIAAFSPDRTGLGPETVVRHRFGNGIVLLVKENPISPSVRVEGLLSAGSVRETDDTAGLANLTAGMLRRGTARHTYLALNQALDDVGASIGLGADLDEVEFGGQSLVGDFGLLMGLLADVLMQPTTPEDELDKLRGQFLTHLGILEMDTGYRADEAFMAALYAGGHPYGRQPMGTRQTLRAFDREAVQRFYRNYYVPDGLIMSVVGGIGAQEVIDRIGATLGQWHSNATPPAVTLPPAATPPEAVVRRVPLPGKSQVDLIWGTVGMPRTSPDYYAAVIADLVLGRLGLMGRLGANVRDAEGLAYYVSSHLEVAPGPHPWSIAAGVNPASIERAVALILQEVARMRDEPITDEELADSRSYLTGALPLHLETNAGIAGFLLRLERYGLGLDYLQRYPGIIHSVTKEDIQRVVRRYLTLDRYVLSMSGTFA
ncbi:MAG: M16 family metallopeptidase [Anaerolineae bacterium]